jgi:hypothetical protein
MAATAQTRNWDIAWTTSMDVHRKRITDNINNQNTTLETMRKSGRVEVDRGGRIMREDLYYANGTMEWMSGRQPVSTDEPDGVSAAFYETRYAVVPLVISWTDQQESQTSEAATRLLATKTIQARNTLQAGINAAMWAAQSDKSMLGFQDILDLTPTVGTLGGINKANESWWRNIVDTSAPNWDNKTGDVYDGLNVLGSVYNQASDGNDEITDIFTGLTIYGETQSILEGTGYARLSAGKGGTSKIDAGKPAFRGATIHKDRDVPSGRLYGINSKYFKLKIQKGANFAKTEFVKGDAAGQLARVSFMVAGLQLVTNNPRRGFVVSGVT